MAKELTSGALPERIASVSWNAGTDGFMIGCMALGVYSTDASDCARILTDTVYTGFVKRTVAMRATTSWKK